MRMTIYIIIVLTIGGLAGLYQLDSLMVLFLTGIILFILLFMLSWQIKGKVSAEFANHQDLMNKGDFFFGTIKLTNITRIPLVHVRVWMEWENRMTGQKGKDILQGTCPPSASAELEYVWEAETCGEIRFTLTKVETSDFFRLFKRRSRIEDKTAFLVLPPPEEISWSLAAPPEGEETGPYQQGDMVKHIHWKLSARMDDLLVRHYHASAVPEAVFYLELKPWPESEPEKTDVFLRRMASVLTVLVQEGWMVRLVWDSAYADTGADTGNAGAAKAEKEEGKAPEWAECTVCTQQDYLGAMGEVMEALGHGRIKLPKRKGRFGAVLDLYEKNEEKEAEKENVLADEGELFLKLNFSGQLYVNHVLAELEEEGEDYTI